MKRLYFLVPDVTSASNIVEELKQAGIAERHIYLVGKDHHLLEDAHLHEAGVLQMTDFVHYVERGAMIGGSAGLLAGVLAVSFPPAGLALGGGALLGLGLFGAGFGAWASSMLGVSTLHPKIKQFERELEKGKLLMLVDIKRKREDEIVRMVKAHHPEAAINGVPLDQETRKPSH